MVRLQIAVTSWSIHAPDGQPPLWLCTAWNSCTAATCDRVDGRGNSEETDSKRREFTVSRTPESACEWPAPGSSWLCIRWSGRFWTDAAIAHRLRPPLASTATNCCARNPHRRQTPICCTHISDPARRRTVLRRRPRSPRRPSAPGRPRPPAASACPTPRPLLVVHLRRDAHGPLDIPQESPRRCRSPWRRSSDQRAGWLQWSYP